jgi:drug/metabolite transporter (DMT)-like permease
MRRTSIPVLIALALAGGVVGWLGQLALAARSAPTLTPPLTLFIALFGIAVVVIVLGWPIRQVQRGKRTRPVDPFFAMRVLVFAKASSLTGALLVGVGAGLVIWALTRGGMPVTPSIWADVLTVAGSLALTVAGLVVEAWCRIPPEDREQAPTQVMERR